VHLYILTSEEIFGKLKDFRWGELPQWETPQVGLLRQDLTEEQVPKVEKILCGCFLPHLGHFSSLSLPVMLRRASNFSPQDGHLYS
jgi:hypothetical protein